MRSLWKGNYTVEGFNTFNNLKDYLFFIKKKKFYFKVSRSFLVTPFISHTVKFLTVHNGLSYNTKLLEGTGIGYKSGEFIFTKKRFHKIHINKKNKK